LNRSNFSINLKKAQQHLSRRDPLLKPWIRKVGTCSLLPESDGFVVLSRSIISQQLSTKAAMTIGARLLEAIGKPNLSPEGILSLPVDSIRKVGLSRAKAVYLRDLAEKVDKSHVRFEEFRDLDDEEVIDRLIQINGIGRWTAEMFLIFSQGRSDVLPVADLGLRAGVRDLYGLTELPDKKRLSELAEPWRPYRSIATWYIWRIRDMRKN
jgi:DNA-3-methyladenine glycosylase II